jgi:hypothetical protein
MKPLFDLNFTPSFLALLASCMRRLDFPSCIMNSGFSVIEFMSSVARPGVGLFVLLLIISWCWLCWLCWLCF